MTDHKREVMIARTARVCHEANRAWCLACGDASQPAWHDAPQWQLDSAIDGVRFHLDNPDAGDSASHDNWMRHKLADGWTYGEVKDPEAKTHPCMVPFDQLPPEQQTKDRLFRAIVHAIHQPAESGVQPLINIALVDGYVSWRPARGGVWGDVFGLPDVMVDEIRHATGGYVGE